MNKPIPKTPIYTEVWGPGGGGVLKYGKVFIYSPVKLLHIQIEMFECTQGIELYTDSIP